MKVVVSGVTPGGLTACAALARQGHEVVLVGAHGSREPDYVLGDVGVLERRGLFGDVPAKDFGAVPLSRNQFLFSDGEAVSGFTTDFDGEKPLLLERRKLVEWLLNRVRKTGVRDRSEAMPGALIRNGKAARGIWTDSGPVEADVVYLAEGNFSWLTRQEGYHRTLPGEDPDYLLNLRKRYVVDDREEHRSGTGGTRMSRPGTVTTIVLPPYPSDPPLNCVFRITAGEDHLLGDLMVPYEGYRAAGTSVGTLMAWAESLPVLSNLAGSEEASPPETSLALAGGRSRWTSLCDHGLALGGEGAGTSEVFPSVDQLGPPLHFAYQFSRALDHLERSKEDLSRESLETYYVRPLKESTYAQRATRLDPWVNIFLENDQARLSGAASALATGELSTDWVPSEFVKRLQQFPLDSWTLPSFESASNLGRDLYREFFASIEMDADKFVVGSGDIGWGRRILLGAIRRCLFGEDERSSGEFARSLVALLRSLGAVASESVSRRSSSNPGSVTTSERPESQPVLGPGPTPKMAVDSSLNDGVNRFRNLEVACPADVFELQQESGRRDFSWSPEHCTECGVCRFGEYQVDFVEADASRPGTEGSSEPSGEVLRNLYGQLPSRLPEQIQAALRKARSRFRAAERTLANSPFLTRDARRWIQGQLNLVRGEIREREFPEQSRAYRREFLSLLDRIRRVLSRDQYRYTRQLLLQGVKLFLPLTESTDTTVEPPLGESTGREPERGENGWLRSRVRRFADQLEQRFRERIGFPRGNGENQSVALVVPGENDELVSIGSADAKELVVPQEGGFWAITPRDLNPVQSLELADDLRVCRFELSTGTARRSPDLDYRESLEPFAGLIMDLQEDFLTDLKAVLELGEITRGRATGPDELLPIASLEGLGTCLGRVGDGSNQSFEVILLDLFARQEMLLGPDFGCLESMVHLRDELTSSGSQLEDAGTLLELLGGSLPELSNEVFARDLTSVDGSDPLGLSPEERERWEEGDTGGIVDDSVRQWRTALGELRQLTGDPTVSSEEVGVFTARLWQTRYYIEYVQDRLRAGGAPRRQTLFLDLLMRRVFCSRQPLGPVSSHPLQSSSEGSASPPEPSRLKTTIDELTVRFEDRASSEQTFACVRPYRSLLESLSEGEQSLASSTIRQVVVLLVEADVLMEKLGSRGCGAETFLRARLLRVHAHLGRFLSSEGDLACPGSRNSRAHTWRRTSKTLRKRFTEGLYEDAFKRRVRGITDQFRGNMPLPSGYFEEKTERESLERSLELFSPPLSRSLQNRTNLYSLYDQYVRMIAELLRLEQNRDRRPGKSGHGGWVREELLRRSRNVLRSTSSLFIHGTRDITDGIEPPEAQVLDLLEPGTIFSRRYRSIG